MTSDVQRAAQRVAGVARLIERTRGGGTGPFAERRATVLRLLLEVGPCHLQEIADGLEVSAGYASRIVANLVAEGLVRRPAASMLELDPDHPDNPPPS